MRFSSGPCWCWTGEPPAGIFTKKPAPAQAEAADRLLHHLTEEEAGYYRRGRNAAVHNIPKNATHSQYSKATGLEALFGALYLLGQTDRIRALFTIIMEDRHAT